MEAQPVPPSAVADVAARFGAGDLERLFIGLAFLGLVFFFSGDGGGSTEDFFAGFDFSAGFLSTYLA